MPFQSNDMQGLDFDLLNRFFSGGLTTDGVREQSQRTTLDTVDISTTEWYFDGIRMGHSAWTFKKPTRINWNYTLQNEMVTFMAGGGGIILEAEAGNDHVQMLRHREHNLFYSGTGSAGRGVLTADRPEASLFFIQFPKEAFLSISSGAGGALNTFRNNVSSSQPTMLSAHNLPFDHAMQSLLDNIRHCSFRDGLKQLYLLSKSIEFLVLQADKCTGHKPSYRYLKTNYDQECIRYARECILSQIESPPSLSELARMSGINEYKLKRGFKEMFGTTVFGCVADARLELARASVLDTDRSITDIAAGLGYASVQHFCSAFRKKFGTAPGKLR